jgi:hypothetical protein
VSVCPSVLYVSKEWNQEFLCLLGYL